MKLSNKLKKISSFINDSLQKTNSHQYNIKLFNEKIFIINSFKFENKTEKQIKQQITLMIKELEKHANFIQSKVQFYLNKKQAPKKFDEYILVFGAYNCKNVPDDEIKKIIYQWKNFGYKGGFSTYDKHIKTTQNSVY